MIEEYFTLKDWEIKVFLIKNKCNVEKVIEALWKLGCNSKQATEAYEDIKEIRFNVGFTYSNFLLKKSIMLIGLQESDSQLINTIVHESRHLQQHIALVKGLDQNGEGVCYLIGKISQILYDFCKKYNLI